MIDNEKYSKQLERNSSVKFDLSDYDFTKIPLDDIVSLGQRTMLYRDLFTVSWILSRFCNFACSYCWPHGRSSTKDFRDLNVYLGTIDEIKRQARENGFNSFHFSLSGGEPTVNPYYLEILKHLGKDVDNTNYTSIHMTTNMSRNMKWFKEYANLAQMFHRASITASFHKEFAVKEPFVDKLLYCISRDIQVTINMVMVPDWFWDDYENALYFHNQGLNVTLKPQSDEKAAKVVDGYTDEMLQILHNGMPQRDYTTSFILKNSIKKERPSPKYDIKRAMINAGDSDKVPQIMQVELQDKDGNKHFFDQAERFNSFNFNKFKGWMCNSGYQGIVIREPDGNIKRSYSCHDKPLGNIETGFKLFDSPKECITPTCVSSADSKIPKRKQ